MGGGKRDGEGKLINNCAGGFRRVALQVISVKIIKMSSGPECMRVDTK